MEVDRLNGKRTLFKEVVQAVNQTLGRKAVTVERINQLVKETKRIRQARGTMALLQYLTHMKEQLFTPAELERLKKSPKQREFSFRMLDLLVHEHVITPREAQMLKRMVP